MLILPLERCSGSLDGLEALICKACHLTLPVSDGDDCHLIPGRHARSGCGRRRSGRSMRTLSLDQWHVMLPARRSGLRRVSPLTGVSVVFPLARNRLKGWSNCSHPV